MHTGLWPYYTYSAPLYEQDDLRSVIHCLVNIEEVGRLSTFLLHAVSLLHTMLPVSGSMVKIDCVGERHLYSRPVLHHTYRPRV